MSKFKVGDRVRVKEVEVGSSIRDVEFVDGMAGLCGHEGVVNVIQRYSDGEECVCGIDFDNSALDSTWFYADEWLELIETAKQASLESLDLVSLLKGCEGVELWSPIFGNCKLTGVDEESLYPIEVSAFMSDGMVSTRSFTAGGYYINGYLDSACVLWPSRDCQTWDGWVPPRWRAKKGEAYWFVTTAMKVFQGREDSSVVDDGRWKVGNYFCSSSECEAVTKKIKVFFKPNES